MKQIRLIAVICLLASAASATVFQPVSDRQLVDRSDSVVIATVRDASSHLRADGYIATDYRFDVEQTLKGAAAGTITVSEIGGVSGSRFTFIADSASYTPGEQVMVFLKKRGDGTYFTTSMAMGKFSFTRTARGESVVTRDVSELRDDPARFVDGFGQFVKGGKSDAYQTKLTPIASGLHPIATAAPSAYVLTACGAPGCFPVRVAGGEAGAGLQFRSSGSLAAADGPGGIASAAATWTNDPDSFIVLSYAGTSASSTPNENDHVNVVYLGYSGPDIGVCDGGMACTFGAGNFTHPFKGETFVSIDDADIIVRPGVSAAQYALLITHEIGHAIGFRHSDQGSPFSSTAVMASSVTTGVLQSWDLEALSFVYGNGPVCQPPTSVSISGGGTYPSGQTPTLTATVTGGNGTFTFAWFEGNLNDTSQPRGTNSNTFTTPAVTASKNYWVRVSNACGTVTATTSVNLQPTGPGCTPVSIAIQPTASQSVNSGGAVTLTVTAGGTAPFNYQWYQATSTLDTSHPVGSNSPSFTTPALTQATSYWVSVTNACGVANSNIAAINITGQCTPPSFAIQPASATIVAGSQTYLIAFATGASSYQWYKGNAGDTSTPVAGVGPSNDRWINQLYIDLLGRTADSAALSSLNALLTGGATRNSVAAVVLTSAEYRQRLLTDFYSTFLHRPISAAEVSFWAPAFASGMTDEQIEAQILASPEYFALGSSSNSSWINRVYNEVLGRSPSGAETSAYLTLLGSNSRLSVGLSILNSLEAASRRVQLAFPRFLHRSPTAFETSTFVAQLQGGVTDEQFLAQLLASDEYVNFGTILFTGPISVTTRFWVRATNGNCTSDSSVATLTVPQCTLPVIVTQPSNVTLTAGETFSVAVIATGGTSYQWFRAQAVDPSNPISGATGPVLTSSINNVGPTNFWVRITNECGSTNSNTVTVTTQCGPRVPLLSAPPIAPSASSYPITWNGSAQRDAAYELQEATKSDFSDAQTFTINGATTRTFTHTVTADTRFYYRVHAAPACGGNFGTFSLTASVLVAAPQSSRQPNFNFAQLPCPQSPCTITQQIFIPGITASGKTALATGDTFSISSDESFITISPSSGALPSEGATVTATIDLSQLDVGSTQASLTINRAPAAAKVGAFGDTPPPTNVPVSVSVVAPVTPKAKDPNGGFNALIIPAIAHADGIGSRFVSDVRLTNTASQSIDYELTYTPNGTDGTVTGKQVTLTVKAGDTKALNDIVKDWYGSGVLGEPPQGSLEIRPLNFAGKDPVSISLATVAASRTYSVAATGTFGQYIPALALVNFLSKASASKISLQQVSQSSATGGFRTNLGFIEGSGQAVDFVATLLDDAGHTVAERAYSLKPYESQQQRLDQFFSVSSITDGRVEVRVTSDTGHVSSYASVLDNTTTDPLLVFPADPAKISAKRFVVPGVAEFDNSFSNFHTDMRIYNGGTSPVDVTLAFTGASVPNKVKTIGAGETLAVDNVLPTLWNITGGGSVVATTASESQLVVTARTFSRDKSNGGTFGQFIPGVTAAEAVGNGDRALQIVQLEESPAFRTNLGLVEVTGNPITVELLAYSPDSKVAARTVVPLGAGEYLQKGGIFKSLGFNNVYNGRITARVISGTGRVASYGSVIDNRTTDPTYVPSQ
ncbi:MAG TPA: M57 family metalloprotease [Thermoanaerobaculia bacterium]|nr:M57 family metalloprotease [Thermoanaerobaculia bacterium]